MRELNDDFKISVRGIEEVDEALGMLVARSKADRSIRFKTHTPDPAKPGRAAVVCALILWLEARPPEEQKRIVVDGLAKLDACLAMDSPGGGTARQEDVTGQTDVTRHQARKGNGKGKGADGA